MRVLDVIKRISGNSLVVRALIIGAFILVLVWWLKPLLIQYFMSYCVLIFDMAYNDHERHLYAHTMIAQTEWRLHTMEMQYNQDWCKTHRPLETKTAWLTAMTNDDFVIGAIALAYVLQKLSCHSKKITLVSDEVSEAARRALSKAGYEVKLVEALDCNWMDVKKARPIQNRGIPGTHMRFHAWNYTEYKKIVYLDGDALPLVSIDELFDLEAELAAAYCSRPGVIDPCFNAGLILFNPNSKSHKEIMDMWSSLSDDSCPNDQVLLWHFYADRGRWTPLPYAYNVRRQLYHPMKVYHFACCLTPKPWRINPPPTKLEASVFTGPFLKPEDMVMVWWKYFYEALDAFELNDWWAEIKHKRLS